MRGIVYVIAFTVCQLVSAQAAEKLPLKFTLEWKFTGATAFFPLAAERGYYAAEGLDVVIDAGQGSEASLTRVASGAYDLGFSDVNSLIPFDGAHPDRAMKEVMIAHDASPYAACTIKGRGIETPKDLAGKTVGAPVFEDALHFFPSFARAVGIDDSSVKRQNLDPSLRSQMLVRKQVDFITALSFGCYVELEAAGISKDDIIVFQYSDYGLPFYGNALVVSSTLAKNHPEAVKAFVRATIKGMRDVIADNQAGIEAVKKRDPLISEKVELERLRLALAHNILTPTVLHDGVGFADPDRIAKSVGEVVATLKLPRAPDPSEIYTNAFLPAREDRLLK